MAEPEPHDRMREDEMAIEDALAQHGIALADVTGAANCHLHFDHSGQNVRLTGVPIFVQRAEWEKVYEPDYTVPEWIDVPSLTYELSCSPGRRCSRVPSGRVQRSRRPPAPRQRRIPAIRAPSSGSARSSRSVCISRTIPPSGSVDRRLSASPGSAILRSHERFAARRGVRAPRLGDAAVDRHVYDAHAGTAERAGARHLRLDPWRRCGTPSAATPTTCLT